jgi:hypothetical protein
MTEPDNFLQRWSKRKFSNSEQPAPEGEERPQQSEKQNEQPAPQEQDVATGTDEEKPFDLASLPSIESIDAKTDVTAFLRPGVPPELSRAALRRAWSTDPAIRDFVGLVENGWDFNDPNAMPGFGTITPGEVARLATQLFGELPAAKNDAPLEATKNPALAAGGDPKATTALPASADALKPHQHAAPSESPDARDDATNVASQKDSEG